MRLRRRRHLNDVAIHGDHIHVWIGARAQLADNAPVHGDPALKDHIFRWPERRDTGARQDFM
jgi:carbonic anhydrase/acetyltransferase-like protein (isoleucine patch superfamily)